MKKMFLIIAMILIPTVAMAEIQATYISGTQFTVYGDYSNSFTEWRKVRADCGADGYKYGVVDSSSYSPSNTTVILKDSVLTSNLISVLFSVQSSESSLYMPHVMQITGVHYFVRTDGSDSKSGRSPEESFLTIGKAIDTMSPGDCIHVGAGVYTETGLDLDCNYTTLRCEMGTVIDPASGTALTVSGDYARVNGDGLVITPAADVLGLHMTGEGASAQNIKIVGNGFLGGVLVEGDLSDIINVRTGGYKAGGKGIEIDANRITLKDCIAQGVTTSYGIYLNGPNTGGEARGCMTFGNQTSGIYVETGVTGWAIENHVSGAGDGARVDVDHAQVWSNYHYDDFVAASITFDGSGPGSFNILEITGAVRIVELTGEVTTSLSNDIGGCYLDVYDGANSVTLTDSITTPSLDSVPAQSIIHKIGNSDEDLKVEDSSQVRLYEDDSRFGLDPIFMVVGKAGATTVMRFIYDDVGTSGEIEWHFRYQPVSDDGFIETP